MTATPSPASLLTAFSSPQPPAGPYLVTGERGAGKTSWLKKLIAAAQQADFQVCGLLSPGIFENDSKVAINLIDLASGEERIMSTPAPANLFAGKGGLRLLDHGEFVLGGWLMHTQALQWGNDLLFKLLTSPPATANQPAKLLIIDELGPLEFVHNLGFTRAIQYGRQLNQSSLFAHPNPVNLGDPSRLQPAPIFRAAFIVVRPGLLPNAQAIWPRAPIVEIQPTSSQAPFSSPS